MSAMNLKLCIALIDVNNNNKVVKIVKENVNDWLEQILNDKKVKTEAKNIQTIQQKTEAKNIQTEQEIEVELPETLVDNVELDDEDKDLFGSDDEDSLPGLMISPKAPTPKAPTPKEATPKAPTPKVEKVKTKKVKKTDNKGYEIDFKFRPVLKKYEKTFTNKALNELNKIGIHIVNKIIELSNNNINNEETQKVLKDIISRDDLIKVIGKKINNSFEHAKEKKKTKSLDKKYKLKVSSKDLEKYITNKNVNNNTQGNIASIAIIVQKIIGVIVDENIEDWKVKKVTDKHIKKANLDVINQSALEGLENIEGKIIEKKSKKKIKKDKKPKQQEPKEEKKEEEEEKAPGLPVNLDTSKDEAMENMFKKSKPMDKEVQKTIGKMYKKMCKDIKKFNTYKKDVKEFVATYMDEDDQFTPEDIFNSINKRITKLYQETKKLHREHPESKTLNRMIETMKKVIN